MLSVSHSVIVRACVEYPPNLLYICSMTPTMTDISTIVRTFDLCDWNLSCQFSRLLSRKAFDGLFYLWFIFSLQLFQFWSLVFTPQPSGLEGYCGHNSGGWARGRAGACQTSGTHIYVTAWRIFSIRISVELSRPVVVHCHGHLPIALYGLAHGQKNVDLPHLKFNGLVYTRSCATLQLFAQWPIWACPWAKSLSNQAALGSDFAEPISLKPLDGFTPF